MSDEEIAALRMALVTLPMSQIILLELLPEDLERVFGVEERRDGQKSPDRARRFLCALPDAYYQQAQHKRLARVPLLAQEYGRPQYAKPDLPGLRQVVSVFAYSNYWSCAWARVYTGVRIDV